MACQHHHTRSLGEKTRSLVKYGPRDHSFLGEQHGYPAPDQEQRSNKKIPNSA